MTDDLDLAGALLEELEGVDAFARLGYVPTPRQKAFHDSTADEVLFGGAMAGGKSKALTMHALREAVRYPGLRVGCFRRTFGELEESLLLELRRCDFAGALGARWTKSARELVFPGGSLVRFMYAEDVEDASRRQGGEYQLLVIDEVGLMSPEVVWRLQERLRTSDPTLPVLGTRMSANPGGPGHAWLRRHFVDATDGGKVVAEDEGLRRAFIPAKATDNPYVGAGYMRQLAAIPDPARRRAMADGDWDTIADSAFEDWRPARLLVSPFPIPATWTRFAGLDWGWTSPSVVIWGARDNDGRVWIYDELTRTQTAPPDLAGMVLSREYSTLGDDAGELVQVEVVKRAADPSCWSRLGASLDVASQMGLAGCGLVKADNDRLNGKARMHTFLAEAPPCEYHRQLGWRSCPMIHVLEGGAPELTRSMPALRRDPSRPEDVEKGPDDHWYDAARYLLLGIGHAPTFYDMDAGPKVSVKRLGAHSKEITVIEPAPAIAGQHDAAGDELLIDVGIGGVRSRDLDPFNGGHVDPFAAFKHLWGR